MEYLRLEEVSKSYGEKVLLDRINLTISKGNKIALIAKNGSGKSTLLRVIAGTEAAEGERAQVYVNKAIKTAFLDQDPQLDESMTIEEVLYDTKDPALQAVKAYNEALADGGAEEIEAAMLVMDDLKAWDRDATAKELLYKLALIDMDQLVHTLSGGQRKRLAMAQIILGEPEFLILDEPTNHLDIEMIEWLESYLAGSALTLLMVTHDRYFLERVCNEIIELDKGQLFIYRGNYSAYLEKKSMREAQDKSSIGKAQKLLAKGIGVGTTTTQSA